ncbi:amino acid ABC transporter permease [Spirochaeta dissipatitropha]
MDFSFLLVYWPIFLRGAANTIVLAFFTVILGSIIGMIVALLKLSPSRLFRFLASAYIEVVRGTPLLVQIFIIYYGLPFNIPSAVVLGVDLSRFIPGIIALSINSGAYVAEIIRAGIQAVDKGQMEAARSLGFNTSKAMKLVILPQAVKNILPALGNEFVVIIKESSIVSVIGISELMYNSSIVRGVTYRPMEPLLVAALLYFIMTFSLSKGLGIAERRLRSGD